MGGAERGAGLGRGGLMAEDDPDRYRYAVVLLEEGREIAVLCGCWGRRLQWPRQAEAVGALDIKVM